MGPLRAIVAWLAAAHGAAACEPCAQVLDVDASLARASLVVAGRRSDWTAAEQAAWARQQGPDTIAVRVERVLKGAAGPEIAVNSWNGMCPYGIVVDGERYVMILAGAPPEYDSVDSGCAAKALRMRGDEVEVDGAWMPLGELQRRIGSPPAR